MINKMRVTISSAYNIYIFYYFPAPLGAQVIFVLPYIKQKAKLNAMMKLKKGTH